MALSSQRAVARPAAPARIARAPPKGLRIHTTSTSDSSTDAPTERNSCSTRNFSPDVAWLSVEPVSDLSSRW